MENIREKHFKIHDGDISLDAVLDMPHLSGTEKPALCIIIHGFTGNKDERHLIAVSDMMNSLGIATLRVDMFGHGLSDGEFKNHTLDIWVSNASAVLDYACSLNEFSKIILCGHSQGGLTVILTGAQKQELTDCIIPLSPALTIPEGARAGDLLGNRFDPETIPDEFQAKEGWILRSGYIKAAQRIHVEDYIRAYHKPVMIAHGSEDMTIPVDYVKKAAADFDDCTFDVIEGDSHCFDDHLEEMVEAVRKFLVKAGY